MKSSSLCLSALYLLRAARGAPPAVQNAPREIAAQATPALNVTTHEPIPIQTSINWTTTTVYTVVTPSPDASPITITRQGQWITTYQPEVTYCPLPTSNIGPSPAKRQLFVPLYNATNISSNLPTAVYRPTSTCSTLYRASITPICRSTLRPIGGLPITVSKCDQDVTFSSDHGITTDFTGGRANVRVLTTKYHATWSSLLTGVPSGTVTADVCDSYGKCTTYLERWGVSSTPVVTTSTSIVSVYQTASGVSYSWALLADRTLTSTLTLP
jgi:hypothetical protein